MFKTKVYCLTRLGFGLNVALLVMRFILRIVWLQDEFIRRARSVYINNIFVNENNYPDASVKDSEVGQNIRRYND